MTARLPDRPRCALVVDDEPVVRQLLARALEEAGWLVHPAANGVDAIRLLVRLPGPPDVLVTDLRMDQVDGPDLARLVAEIYPAVPVLFVSGYLEDLQHRRLPGPLLPKPFHPEELVRAVESLVGAPAEPQPRASRPPSPPTGDSPSLTP